MMKSILKIILYFLYFSEKNIVDKLMAPLTDNKIDKTKVKNISKELFIPLHVSVEL